MRVVQLRGDVCVCVSSRVLKNYELVWETGEKKERKKRQDEKLMRDIWCITLYLSLDTTHASAGRDNRA